MVNYAGDVNDDGIDDLIIGSPGVNLNTGVVHIIQGSENLNSGELSSLFDHEIIGHSQGDLFGRHAISIGDVDNDQLDDF